MHRGMSPRTAGSQRWEANAKEQNCLGASAIYIDMVDLYHQGEGMGLQCLPII